MKTYNDNIAVKLGINEAILANWIYDMWNNSANYHHENFWVRCSYRMITAKFPFMGVYGAKYAIKKLTDAGIIAKGEYNSTKFDRTNSYAITEYGQKLIKSEVDNGN